MNPAHWFALCIFCLSALYMLLDLICTRWGYRLAWAIIIICLAYLSVP